MRSSAGRPAATATPVPEAGTPRPGGGRASAVPVAGQTPVPTGGATPVSGPVRLLGPVVRPVSPVVHHRHIERLSGAYLQAPQSARAVPGQVSENLGWFNGKGRLVGSALVLYRRSTNHPGTEARVPGGPTLPWNHVAADPRGWLVGLQDHVSRAGSRVLSISPEVPLRMCSAETFLQGDGDLDSLAGPTASHLAGTSLATSLRRAGWALVEDPRPLVQRVRSLIPLGAPPGGTARAVPGAGDHPAELNRLHRGQLDVVSDLYAEVLGVVPMAQYWSRSRLNRLWDAFTPPSPQSAADAAGDSFAETGHDTSWERTRPIAFGLNAPDGRLLGAVIAVQLGGRINLVRAVRATGPADGTMTRLIGALVQEGRRLGATALDLGPADVFVGLETREALEVAALFGGTLYEPIGRWSYRLR